jgi:hypothetical protein
MVFGLVKITKLVLPAIIGYFTFELWNPIVISVTYEKFIRMSNTPRTKRTKRKIEEYEELAKVRFDEEKKLLQEPKGDLVSILV